MDILNNIFSATPIVQGGMTLMAAGWLGYQLRAVPSRIVELFRLWTTRIVEVREFTPLYDAWLAMLTEAAVRKGGPRTVEVRAIATEDQDAPRSAFRAGSSNFYARVRGKWCHVSIGREEGGTRQNPMAPRFIIRAEFFHTSRRELDALLELARRRADVNADRQCVDLFDRWGSRRTFMLPKRASSTLCLPPGFYDRLYQRAAEFLDSREQYERYGIPYRLGILLHGHPGTGKTSLAHALASQLGLRLCVIPLADVKSDEELVNAFASVGRRTIVLIEDVDSAFRQRTADEADGISFSTFLNCIDGMLAPQAGQIVIMTTNHIDQLDPALIRPGRIDLRVEVPTLDRQAAADYVDRLFPHVATRHDLVAEVLAQPQPTAAALINRIMRESWRRPERSALVAPAALQPTPIDLKAVSNG